MIASINYPTTWNIHHFYFVLPCWTKSVYHFPKSTEATKRLHFVIRSTSTCFIKRLFVILFEFSINSIRDRFQCVENMCCGFKYSTYVTLLVYATGAGIAFYLSLFYDYRKDWIQALFKMVLFGMAWTLVLLFTYKFLEDCCFRPKEYTFFNWVVSLIRSVHQRLFPAQQNQENQDMEMEEESMIGGQPEGESSQALQNAPRPQRPQSLQLTHTTRDLLGAQFVQARPKPIEKQRPKSLPPVHI